MTESFVPVAALNLFNDDDDDELSHCSSCNTGLSTFTSAHNSTISSNPGEYFFWYDDSGVRHCPLFTERERDKRRELPVTVKIKGVVSTTRASVELVVPVSRILRCAFEAGTQPQSGDGSISNAGSDSGFGNVDMLFSQLFLHILAAKALIIDGQDDKHAFPDSTARQFQNDQELKEAFLRKEIVRLRTAYILASKDTSFVVVDHRFHEGIGGKSSAES